MDLLLIMTLTYFSTSSYTIPWGRGGDAGWRANESLDHYLFRLIAVRAPMKSIP